MNTIKSGKILQIIIKIVRQDLFFTKRIVKTIRIPKKVALPTEWPDGKL